MEDILKKYRDRLEVMKENRAKQCDRWNDAENYLADREIELTAEMCRDLNYINNVMEELSR